MTRNRYVLVTAAYNEEGHIAATLHSVASQNVLPHRWVIVSDGSTDRTDDIVLDWVNRHPFIEFVRVERSAQHSFAAKVHALRQGFARLADVESDFIGVLDADVSFEPDYFLRLIERFTNEPRLGIAGGNIEQHVDGVVVPRMKDFNSVAGAVQLLRRECFEQTGGLPALRYGGEDAAMEITARMYGWQTRTFPELKVVHFGLVGAGAGGPLKARFKGGRVSFDLGYHPVFLLARSVYRVKQHPYLLGSLAELIGFAVSKAQNRQPAVDSDVVRFLRREQLTKLRRLAPLVARVSKAPEEWNR
jgi:glycosyltransferase involved in cell wall biosynthesis